MTKGEHTYISTYICTGQTLYPLHNFVVQGDNKQFTKQEKKHDTMYIFISSSIQGAFFNQNILIFFLFLHKNLCFDTH